MSTSTRLILIPGVAVSGLGTVRILLVLGGIWVACWLAERALDRHTRRKP
jgi:hypothetical protein